MEFSNKIDVLEVLKELQNEIYVVSKTSEFFPNYYQGNDIDILCFDLKKVSQAIIRATSKYIKEGFRTEVTNNDNFSRVYIDIFDKENNLDLRFDLSNGSLDYKKISVSTSYIFSILENRILDKNKVFVPSVVDELVIRYLEYIEWFEERPDKIKHLDFILNKLKNNEEERKFLDKVHMYIKLKLLEVPADSHFGKSVIQNLNNTIEELKKTEHIIMTELGYTNKVVEQYSIEVEAVNKELKKSRMDFQSFLSSRSNRMLYYLGHPRQLPSAVKRKLVRK